MSGHCFSFVRELDQFAECIYIYIRVIRVIGNITIVGEFFSFVIRGFR